MRRGRWLAALLVVPLAACGTLPSGKRWGDDVTLAPGWGRVRDAAVTAARDPGVWAPLAGAAALSVGDVDDDLARWANRETPVFGSRREAERASDKLRDLAEVGYYAVALSAPGGEDFDAWASAKLWGLGVGWGAVAATRISTAGIKSAARRERPDGSDRESFPSGHTSDASAWASSATYNLKYVGLDDPTRAWVRAGFGATTFMTGWARMEAGKHHPTDVLAGAALGRFFALFMHGALFGLHEEAPVMVVVPHPRGVVLRLVVPY